MGKGQDWERTLSKWLSLWLTDGDRDDVVWRSTTSGARATVRARQGRRTSGQYGDLTWTDPGVSPFFEWVTVEAKKGYTGMDLLSLLDGKQSTGNHLLEQFITQARDASSSAGVPYFMLVLYRDRHAPVVLFPLDLWEHCLEACGTVPRTMTTLHIVTRGEGGGKYTLMRLEDWFTWMTPQAFGVRMMITMDTEAASPVGSGTGSGGRSSC